MPDCVTPTQRNIACYLINRKPHGETIGSLRFVLDQNCGHAWKEYRVARAIAGLARKGHVSDQDGTWKITPEGEEYWRWHTSHKRTKHNVPNRSHRNGKP